MVATAYPTPNVNSTRLFENVMELPGVEGIALFALTGEVRYAQMPAALGKGIPADAIRRIAALYEAVDENLSPQDDYLLRYQDHWFMLRRVAGHVLLIMGSERANVASVRMASNMVVRRITPEVIAELADAAAEAAPISTMRTAPKVSIVPTHEPQAAPAAVSALDAPAVSTVVATAAEAPKRFRSFRGQAY